jgi:hypothetical protein
LRSRHAALPRKLLLALFAELMRKRQAAFPGNLLPPFLTERLRPGQTAHSSARGNVQFRVKHPLLYRQAAIGWGATEPAWSNSFEYSHVRGRRHFRCVNAVERLLDSQLFLHLQNCVRGINPEIVSHILLTAC